MKLIIYYLWLILSIFAISIDQHRWPGLFKLFFASSVAAFLFNGWTVYDPDATIGYAVTIEQNPTWNAALLLSLEEGACITGPIAAIHAFQDWLRNDRHIHINPFRKADDYEKEARKRLLENEASIKAKTRQSDKLKGNAKKLCRSVHTLEIIQKEYVNKPYSHVDASFVIKNIGSIPVTDIKIRQKLKMENYDSICVVDATLGDEVLAPGEEAIATGDGFVYTSNDFKGVAEYTYRYYSESPTEQDLPGYKYGYKVDTISREAYLIEKM